MRLQETKEKNNIEKVIIFIISISCILLQYIAAVFTYGFILLLIMMIYMCVKNKKIYIDKDFAVLITVLTIQQIVTAIVGNRITEANIKFIIMMWLIFFTMSLGYYVNDKKILYKYLKVIGVSATVIVFIQYIMINFFDMRVGPIMFIKQPQEYLKNWALSGLRPTGFFSEPQVFCSCILPLIIMALINREYNLVVFFSIGIVLTGSSLGIMMLLGIATIVLFLSNLNYKKKIAFFLLFAVLILLFLNLEIFESARNKIFTIFNDFALYSNEKMTNNHSYTNYLRLLKGWVTYLELPTKDKILGIGVYNFPEYLQHTNVIFSWNSIWSNNAVMAKYFTSAAGTFIECGFFGAMAYIVFLCKKYYHGNSVNRIIIILIAIQSFVTQIFFNNIFIFYFLIYYALMERSEK